MALASDTKAKVTRTLIICGTVVAIAFLGAMVYLVAIDHTADLKSLLILGGQAFTTIVSLVALNSSNKATTEIAKVRENER